MSKEKIWIDQTGFPSSREGLYATNNQFQKSGPKGFIQIKVLENDKLYVRVDLPGVPDDAVRHRVDAVRQKIIFFSGETVRDADVREYSGSAGLACDCCEITDVDAKMKDGVLRMIVTRVKVKDHDKKCTLTLPPFTGKSGRQLEDHPFVVNGRKRAFLGKSAPDGGFYLSVDVPGVPSEDVDVFANETELRFYAENKNVYEHDESGRVYLGRIDSRFTGETAPPSLLDHSVSGCVEFGVLKIGLIPPVNDNDNKNDNANDNKDDNNDNDKKDNDSELSAPLSSLSI